MRPWLVAVGVALVVLGSAVIVGLLYPGDIPTLPVHSSEKVVDLDPGAWRSFAVSAVANGQATVTFNWTASAAVNVSWFTAVPCAPAPNTCGNPPALRTWLGNVSGHWTRSGDSGALYEFVVEVSNATAHPVNFTASFSELYPGGQRSLPMLPFVITMGAGSLLVGMGGVVLYLGLFLPPGTFGPVADPELGPYDDDDLGPDGPYGPT